MLKQRDTGYGLHKFGQVGNSSCNYGTGKVHQGTETSRCSGMNLALLKFECFQMVLHYSCLGYVYGFLFCPSSLKYSPDSSYTLDLLLIFDSTKDPSAPTHRVSQIFKSNQIALNDQSNIKGLCYSCSDRQLIEFESVGNRSLAYYPVLLPVY